MTSAVAAPLRSARELFIAHHSALSTNALARTVTGGQDSSCNRKEMHVYLTRFAVSDSDASLEMTKNNYRFLIDKPKPLLGGTHLRTSHPKFYRSTSGRSQASPPPAKRSSIAIPCLQGRQFASFGLAHSSTLIHNGQILRLTSDSVANSNNALLNIIILTKPLLPRPSPSCNLYPPTAPTLHIHSARHIVRRFFIHHANNVTATHLPSRKRHTQHTAMAAIREVTQERRAR